jgi:hypothetical protein
MYIYMIIKKRQTVKSDRLIVLLAPDEKARIVALARAQQTSVGELVRSALARLGESPTPREGRAARAPGAQPSVEIPTNGEDEQAGLTAEQATALERLAEIALHRMQKANAALDHAFAEIEATKAHFAAKRRRVPPA